MNDKGLSIGAALNWTLVLFISLFTSSLMTNLGTAGTFLMFGSFNVIGTIFIAVYMKETKGLTDFEVKQLYRKEKQTAPTSDALLGEQAARELSNVM